MFRRASLLIVVLGVLAAPPGASAAVDYPDFSSTAGLALNGDASQAGNVLRLTKAEFGQTSSAFSTTPVNLGESLHSEFLISMHDTTTAGDPADGIAFVIQSEGADALTGGGGGIGYSGIEPSVAVEFDIYYNFGVDPVPDHVAITTEGDTGNHLACATETAPTPPCAATLPFPIYGGPVYAWVDYDVTTQHLSVSLSQTSTKPAAPLLDYQISLAPLGASAFAGFTAATGASTAVQDVLSWRLGSPAVPIAAPLPTAPTPAPIKKCKKKRKARHGKGKHHKRAAETSKKKRRKCGKRKRHKPAHHR